MATFIPHVAAAPGRFPQCKLHFFCTLLLVTSLSRRKTLTTSWPNHLAVGLQVQGCDQLNDSSRYTTHEIHIRTYNNNSNKNEYPLTPLVKFYPTTLHFYLTLYSTVLSFYMYQPTSFPFALYHLSFDLILFALASVCVVDAGRLLALCLLVRPVRSGSAIWMNDKPKRFKFYLRIYTFRSK